MTRPLYIYGVPGKVGGAATKIRDLLRMLRGDFDITVVAGHISFLKDREVTSYLDRLAIRYCLRKDLPEKLDGIALGICELDFFTSGTAAALKQKGLKLVWSNEMMWEFKGEADAVKSGLIDKVLFVSEFQAQKFAGLYRDVSAAIVGNYIDPESFPHAERANSVFTIGRLSRPDPVKYPADFPVFYEELELNDVKFRVQAWSDDLRKSYRWHRFGPEWELLPERKIPTAKFLQSLDLLVYPLGHRVKESWGRAVVEAMLTGAIPLVPAGHYFHNLMVHEESGFICNHFDDFKFYAQQLYKDNSLRRQISRQAAGHARNVICNFEHHRRLWTDALTLDP